MFHYQEKVLTQNTFQFQITANNIKLSFADVIDLWKHSDEFRRFYNSILEEVPFPGFFWENKAVNNKTLQQPYEFVIVGTNVFKNKKATRLPFKEHFTNNASVVSFPNLGKSAQLIVPCPLDQEQDDEDYTHLATFIRNASSAQRSSFWEMVGHEFEKSINNKPTWLSTSGLGVYWLHARLDIVPKYYSYDAYRIFKS